VGILATASWYPGLATTSACLGSSSSPHTTWHSVTCNAVPALGIAQAAIDEFAELATKKTPSYTTTTLKDRPIVQLRFATAVAKVESARAYLQEAFDAAWQGALDGRSLDLASKARLQLASSYVPIAAAEAVT
jgi:alkylation response protein AidB-like acyl-CoA dehydrogenase